MWEYMERHKGLTRLPLRWREAKKMEQNKSELLFYIDTEFAGDNLIEVGIENTAGVAIVNSVVAHQKSW